MNDPRHPIWSFGRIALAMICLTFLLWTQASNFDHTEIQTLAGFFMLSAGGEAAIQWVISRKAGE